MKPEELLYAPTHEWVLVANEGGRKIATVGITRFAVEQLTDLVYMELPEVGRKLTAEEEFGEVESVKAVSPLYSPVSGEVTAVNRELTQHLETLMQDPYESGWLIRVRLSDDASLKRLMDWKSYQAQCEQEG